MAGFRKSKAEQSALKIGIYGPAGSGKTFTSLLLAEGLARISNKRVAYVDTENGTVFYDKAVTARPVHPEGFDFDALKSRSIVEVNQAVTGLKPSEHGVVVIDSITHIWEACRAAYAGKLTNVGTIPFHAWAKIKKPYKELISYLMNSTLHVIICGRQGVEYETNDDTEELKAVGYKMKAEGETAYEPHILIRMEIDRPKRGNERARYVAYAEKDRTGILAGRSFVNPTFETICAPILPLLGINHDPIQTSEDAAAKDAEHLEFQEHERLTRSAETLREFVARFDLAKTAADLKAVAADLTKEVKSMMTPEHVAQLRAHWQAREKEVAK